MHTAFVLCQKVRIRLIHLVFFNFTKRGDCPKNTSLTAPFFIEMTVPSQESGRSCICLLVASILPLSTNFVLDFGNIPTVW